MPNETVAQLLSDEALKEDEKPKEEENPVEPSTPPGDEETPEEEEAKEEESPEVEKVEEGAQADAEPPAPPALSDADKLQLLATDPTLRQMVEREAERRIQAERQVAAQKAEEARVAKLVEEEDWETLGKEFVEARKRGAADAHLRQLASNTLFGEVLPAAVSDPASQAAIQSMSREEVWDLNPDNPINARLPDSQYFAKFVQAVSAKREALAEAKAKATKEKAKEKAAQNQADGQRLRGQTPDVPGGKAGESLQGSARSLLGDFFREEDEARGAR